MNCWCVHCSVSYTKSKWPVQSAGTHTVRSTVLKSSVLGIEEAYTVKPFFVFFLIRGTLKYCQDNYFPHLVVGLHLKMSHPSYLTTFWNWWRLKTVPLLCKIPKIYGCDYCKSHKPCVSSPHFLIHYFNIHIMLSLLSKVLKIHERHKPIILVDSLLIYRLSTRDWLFPTIIYVYF